MTRHTLFPEGWGQSREEGPSRRARSPRREEAYFLYADDRSGEHASRRTLIARLRLGEGPVRPRVYLDGSAPPGECALRVGPPVPFAPKLRHG